jgi:cation diffusion facilitator family transporter
MMADDTRKYGEVQRILVMVLVLNWGVAVAKLVFGIMIKSASMTADGFHSLADGTSNIIGLVGVHFCSQPKDTDHPYGHKKYETLFSLGIAALLFIVAFGLAKEGVMRLMHPVTPHVDVYSFIVMLVTLGVNIAVMTYEHKRGKELGSDLLVVDAMHTRADIVTTLSVLAALTATKLGFPIADPLITIVIAFFIAYTAFEIIKQQADILCDGTAIDDTHDLCGAICSIEGVCGCHKVRTRGRPDDIHLDLHVQVKGDMPLQEAHNLNHAIQAAIMKRYPQITDVLVHMEPAQEVR